MKILFINPHENNIVRASLPMAVEKHTGLFPPLSLLYMASFINSSGRHSAEVLDLVAEGAGALKGRLAKVNPDVVGINTVSFNLLSTLDVAGAVRVFNPDVKIILGGPHVSVFPRETAVFENVDFAVVGEGEKTALSLLDAIEAGGGFEGIPGIAFSTASGIVQTGPSLLIEELDRLPFPDRKLVSYRKHFNILSERYPSTTMFTSRGCPHSCSFCYHSFGRKVRLRSAKNVADEMELLARMGIRDVYFVDDSFMLSRKRVYELCSEILKRGLKLHWAVKGRVDSVDINLLKYMKKSGCRRIHYGVESANPETLERINKKISLESVRQAFDWSRQAGIQTGAELMLGGPGETYEKTVNTVNFAFEINADFAFFYITTPLPGTKLYREGINCGVFESDYWGDFADSPSQDAHIRYWDETISGEALEFLLKKAHFKFYFRPGYIVKRLSLTRSCSMLAKKIKMAFGMGVYSLVK